PGHPIMPGVLIVEAMAQVGGGLMLGTMERPETKVVYFMALDRVRFRRPVRPGDQLRLEVEVLQVRGPTCRMKGVATVDGKVAAEAEMMAQVGDRRPMARRGAPPRLMRWLWTSRRPEARLARLALLPASALYR